MTSSATTSASSTATSTVTESKTSSSSRSSTTATPTSVTETTTTPSTATTMTRTTTTRPQNMMPFLGPPPAKLTWSGCYQQIAPNQRPGSTLMHAATSNNCAWACRGFAIIA